MDTLAPPARENEGAQLGETVCSGLGTFRGPGLGFESGKQR